MKRVDRIRQLAARRQRARTIYIELRSRDYDHLAPLVLTDGEVRRVVGGWDNVLWYGRSGDQFIELLGVYGNPPPAEIQAHIRDRLAEKVQEAANAPQRPTTARREPRAVGDPIRTRGAREAVARATEPPPATRPARCPRCRTSLEVPAEPGAGRCSCGTGGL